MNDNTKEIQNHCLKILEEVIRLCDLYEINYFLVGGSALGAYRHKGFIPWDDDIDIGIVRDQYDKFLEICKKDLGSSFYLQDYSNQGEFIFPYAKIKLNGTSFVEKQYSNVNMHHGIYIDVFPLNYVPKNYTVKKVQITGIKICQIARASKFNLVHSSSFKKTIASLIGKIVPNKGLYLAYKCFTQLEDKERANELVNCVGAYAYEKECMSKEVFGKGKLLEFEHLKCRVPEKIETYLTSLYGENYMQLPPIGKRQTHKPMIVSFNEEYKVQ